MVQSAAKRDVLTALDEHKPTAFIWQLALLATLAIAFVSWFLPETKGLPVEEIVRVFERQRGTLQPVTAVQERARS